MKQDSRFKNKTRQKLASIACRRAGGFTLIEMIVVVGSVGLIVVAVVGTILGTFRANDRIKSNNKLTENGYWMINELRKNILNGINNETVCSVGKTSIEIVNFGDGQKTVLSCLNNKIASTSATEKQLNNNEVTVFGCENFVTCNYGAGSTTVTDVIFSFGLGTTTGVVSVSRGFQTTVTLRN